MPPQERNNWEVPDSELVVRDWLSNKASVCSTVCSTESADSGAICQWPNGPTHTAHPDHVICWDVVNGIWPPRFARKRLLSSGSSVHWAPEDTAQMPGAWPKESSPAESSGRQKTVCTVRLRWNVANEWLAETATKA